MVNELLKLKAEAEHELVYAQAKIEIVDKLLSKATCKVEESVVEMETEESYTDTELEGA